MKKKTLIAGIILLALTGCVKKYSPKNIYEDRFVNGFVETDFGRPRDFIEITDSKIDTIDNMAAMELITAYKEVFFFFNEESRRRIDEMFDKAMRTKGVVHITFKVRMRSSGEIVVREYYGTYNLDDGSVLFGLDKNMCHLLPDVYYELLDFSNDFIEDRNTKSTLLF